MPMLAELVDGVIGVDTHRDTLTAAAVSNLGGVLAQTTTSADAAGYRRLLDFAQTQAARPSLLGGGGAGSFGAGLTVPAAARRAGRGGRPAQAAGRRSGAKSDALDAVRAAREALGHDHRPSPAAGGSGRRCGCC